MFSATENGIKEKIFKLDYTRFTMFYWFFGKKEVEKIKEETKKSFDTVKKDITSLSEWVKYLDNEKNLQKKENHEIKEILSSVQEEIENMKNVLSIMNELKPKGVFKTPKQLFKQQTAVGAVQTAVQTTNFDQFSITERAILWVLLNSELRLSYEDLATMLGKEKSTIRGQINIIKQKSEGLIEEAMERNGKKRVYIPENIKEKMLKKVKVRVKKSEIKDKNEKKRVSEY